MDSSVISVKLDAFDGPLDLLLHLIEKNKAQVGKKHKEMLFNKF